MTAIELVSVASSKSFFSIVITGELDESKSVLSLGSDVYGLNTTEFIEYILHFS
jgi:hypothetical protein